MLTKHIEVNEAKRALCDEKFSDAEEKTLLDQIMILKNLETFQTNYYEDVPNTGTSSRAARTTTVSSRQMPTAAEVKSQNSETLGPWMITIIVVIVTGLILLSLCVCAGLYFK